MSTPDTKGLVHRLRRYGQQLAICDKAADTIERLTAERDALAQFALKMLEAWPLGDVDGCDLQDAAVEHGLLVPTQRTAPCSDEGCSCAEYYSADEWAEGITCYRRAEWLRAARTGGKPSAPAP